MKKLLIVLLLVVCGGAVGHLYLKTEGFKKPVDVEQHIVSPLKALVKSVSSALGPQKLGVDDLQIPQNLPITPDVEDVRVPSLEVEPEVIEEALDEAEEEIEEEIDIQPVQIDGAGEIGEQFEDTLNALVEDVKEAMDGYQKMRDEMTSLVEKENLIDAEVVQKNTQKMEELVKELRGRADKFVKSFEDANSNISDLIAQVSVEERSALREKWTGMVNEQIGLYYQFFNREGDAARTYQKFLRFYANNIGRYKYNMVTQKFEFDNLGTQAVADELRAEVNRMRRAQSRALKMSN
ncbi:MAG: hypothetical protein AAF244_05365 [Pseudomonadota bacterium]